MEFIRYLSNYEHWPDPMTMLLLSGVSLGTMAVSGGFGGKGGFAMPIPAVKGITPGAGEVKEKARADVFGRMAKLRRATLLSQQEEEPKLKKTVLGAG